jgi:hypothetical protein
MSSINTPPAEGVDQRVSPLIGHVPRLRGEARVGYGENSPVEPRILMEKELGSAIGKHGEFRIGEVSEVEGTACITKRIDQISLGSANTRHNGRQIDPQFVHAPSMVGLCHLRRTVR